METFEDIFNQVISELESGLPYWLTYHNIDHTKYVLNQAEKLANRENITGRDVLLVKTAALYHDTGFLVKRDGHETISCQIASRELQDSQFTGDEIDKICGMIKATTIPQSPKTILEKIVADADLYYLGTDRYECFSKKLFSEMKHFNPEINEEAWRKIQQKFLSSHSYHTDYCRTVLEPLKRKNLDSL